MIRCSGGCHEPSHLPAARDSALVSCILASAQALAQNAYITNGFSNTVSVIDTATNTVTATIPVGRFPFGVAVTPDGSKVYVPNIGDNTVSVISMVTGSPIPALPGPFSAAVTADGS